MNTNNGVKWKRFIVPKKVEQINEWETSEKYMQYISVSMPIKSFKHVIILIAVPVYHAVEQNVAYDSNYSHNMLSVEWTELQAHT